MTRAHRRIHAVIWPILALVLAGTIAAAMLVKPKPAPVSDDAMTIELEG